MIYTINPINAICKIQYFQILSIHNIHMFIFCSQTLCPVARDHGIPFVGIPRDFQDIFLGNSFCLDSIIHDITQLILTGSQVKTPVDCAVQVQVTSNGGGVMF